MASVLDNQRDTSAGGKFRDGLFRSCSLCDAVFRSFEYGLLLPLDDEESSQYCHAPFLLSVRRNFCRFHLRIY